MAVLATYIDMKSVEKPYVTDPIMIKRLTKPFIKILLLWIIVLDALYFVGQPGVNPNVSYSSIVIDTSFFIIGLIINSNYIQIVHFAYKLNDLAWYTIDTAYECFYSVDAISIRVIYGYVFLAYLTITYILVNEEEQRWAMKKENKSTTTENKKRDNSVFVIDLKHI